MWHKGDWVTKDDPEHDRNGIGQYSNLQYTEANREVI